MWFYIHQAEDLRRHLIIHSGEKSNKCNQCDHTSHCAYNLRTHRCKHIVEKLNKCNQCDFASSRADNLRRKVKQMQPMWQCIYADATKLRIHLKTHSGEVKQMQPMWLCLFPGTQFKEKSQTNVTNVTMHIYRRLKKHSEENQTSATSVILYPIRQEIWGHIWKHTVEKSYTNVTGVTLPPLGQTLDLDWNLYTVLLYKML